jgi:hypothetical protein
VEKWREEESEFEVSLGKGNEKVISKTTFYFLKGLGAVDPVVECLPSMHKWLNSIPGTQNTNAHTHTHTHTHNL